MYYFIQNNLLRKKNLYSLPHNKYKVCYFRQLPKNKVYYFRQLPKNKVYYFRQLHKNKNHKKITKNTAENN